jgi:hypothetical protein
MTHSSLMQIVEEGESKVTEKRDKAHLKLNIPNQMQGYSTYIEFSTDKMPDIGTGPYKVELILCNDFLIYRDDVNPEDFIEGYSNLGPGIPPKQIREATLEYFHVETKEKRTVTLSFKIQSGIIQKFFLTFRDEPINSVVSTSLRIINPILDAITFQKRIPLKICRIHLHHIPSSFLISTYTTIPYTVNYTFDTADLQFAISIPDELKSLTRLYREAKNCSNSHYRFLCLFKACEKFIEIRNSNSLKARDNNQARSREKIVVPDNDVARAFFKDSVGNNLDEFFNKIRKKYRDSIAHLNFDENGRINFDPGEAIINHEIEAAIELLDYLLHQAIIIELDFMKTRGL